MAGAQCRPREHPVYGGEVKPEDEKLKGPISTEKSVMSQGLERWLSGTRAVRPEDLYVIPNSSQLPVTPSPGGLVPSPGHCVCVQVCMCICVYIYIHTHIYMHKF